MKSLQKFILEQVVNGNISKNEAAEMLVKVHESQGGHASSASKDIAIIGMACRFPPNSDLNAFWTDLAKGRDLTAQFPETRRQNVDDLFRSLREQAPNLKYLDASFLSQVDQFDCEHFGIAPTDARLIDPQQRILLEVVHECFENAGYSKTMINGTKTGVYLGYSDPEYELLLASNELSSIRAPLSSMVSEKISYYFNLVGPNLLIETACSSSLVAVHNACQGIICGDCDMALAGGVSLVLFPFVDGSVELPEMGIQSPDGRTRAFDEECSGFGTGEGAGVILLKPLAKAIEDRDYIFAVIKGSSTNSDGKSNSIAAPNPDAQTKVIVDAWERAGIDPETIAYIEAHGSATRLGDPIEIEGLTNAFRKFTHRKHFCAIGSVKTNMGHLSSAAGIAGLIKTVLALVHRQIPASLYFNNPNPLANFLDAPVYVNRQLSTWPPTDGPRRAGVNSFGVSGTNCHIVLEEHVRSENKVDGEVVNKGEIFTLSAENAGKLSEILDKYILFLLSYDPQVYTLENVCYTANIGRDIYPCRLAIIADSLSDLLEKLQTISNRIRTGATQASVFDPICGSVRYEGETFTEKNTTLDRNMTPAELVQIYLGAHRVRWDRYYIDRKIMKVPLPTYVFTGTQCWASHIADAKSMQLLINPSFSLKIRAR